MTRTTGTLEFTALYTGLGASWLGLDDITFSSRLNQALLR